MKKTILSITILLACLSRAQADDLAAAAKVTDINHAIVSGVVKTVSWADSAKGTRSEIVVLDGAKKKPVNIYVTATTTLWDKEAKAILPEKIVVRSHVNVIYLTTPEGINIAKSIKVLN